MITADGDLRTLPSHLPDRGGMDDFAARLRKLYATVRHARGRKSKQV
jgi:hypothetical protein